MMASHLSTSATGNSFQPSKGRYRPEIDGLRAFAVVAVIINHFNKDLLPSGYLGVDIFFVISGYVITSSLAGRESKNFLDFVTGFYERRIKRLVPSLVVFVLITSVLICLFNPDPGKALKTGATSLFGFSNLYLLKISTDYFAQSTELNPFVHTWSLGVEEQFYFLFPFLIWFSGFGRQTAKGARNLFLWVGAMTIASLIGFIYLYQVNQPAAYFLMPPRFWEMAAGCLIFIGFQKRAKIEEALEQVPPLLVVATMIAVMFLPIAAAVPATIGVVILSAILIACLKSGTAAYSAFTNKRVIYIGLISYPLYLWHWGILSISRWTIGIDWWSAPLLLLLIFALASSSYTIVEKPLRNLSSLAVNRFLIFLTGLLALICSASGLIAAEKVKINGITVSSKLYLSVNPDSRLEAGRILLAPNWSNRSNSIQAIKLANCIFVRPITDDEFAACLNPSPIDGGTSSARHIYIFGDSHATNYAFGIRKAFPGMVGMVTMAGGCGYISVNDAKEVFDKKINCPAYISKVDAFVRNTKRGDVVIVGNDWRKTSIKRHSLSQESAIRRLAEITNQRGVYFILLDDAPPLGDPQLSSPKWYRPFKQEKSISLKDVDRELAGLDAIGMRLAKDYPHARYLKLRRGLCQSNQCYTATKGKSQYYDDGHITVEASEGLAPEVKSQLHAILKPQHL